MRPEPRLELRFPAQAAQLQRVRRRVRELVAATGCPGEQVDRIVLAVNEACMNVIQHAYGGEGSGDMILEAVIDGDEVILRVTDFAEPVDKTTVRSRDLDDVRPGGLGVHLIREVMDDVAFVEPPPGAGNTLEMRTRIRCRGNPPGE